MNFHVFKRQQNKKCTKLKRPPPEGPTVMIGVKILIEIAISPLWLFLSNLPLIRKENSNQKPSLCVLRIYGIIDNVELD